jgi:hypothetical protein
LPHSSSAARGGLSSGYSVVSGGSGTSSVEPVAVGDHKGRAEVARGIGAYFRRCLEGDTRGSSGRRRLNLQNRLYVVLADYNGHKFSLPKVLHEFSSVAIFCKRGPSCGDHIFVGFATIWEVKLAVESAGLAWPEP